jgi:hypothetical protein
MLYLNERWRIDNETHSEELILEKLTKVVSKRKGKKTGHEREEWKLVGYYTTLAGVLKGFYRHYTKGGKDWQDVLARITEVESFVERFFNVEKRLNSMDSEGFRIKTQINL